MTDEDAQLRAFAQWHKPKAPKAPAKLGDIITQYVENELEPRQKKNVSVEEAWRDVVPDLLSAHCRCAGIKQGQVQITVDSPVYRYQLEIRNAELLESLREAVPRLKIRAIKTTIGSLNKN